MREHRAQILEVEQQPAVVIRDLEYDGEHAGLDIVEIQDAREQERSQIGNRGAQRMPLLAKSVQNTVGKPVNAGASAPICVSRCCNLGDIAPLCEMPARS